MDTTLLLKTTGGPLDVNTYAVCNGNDCILIDPGVPEQKVVSMIGKRNVMGVLLTHGHMDHIAGITPWIEKKIPIFCHPLDIPLLQNPDLNLSSKYASESISVLGPVEKLYDKQVLQFNNISCMFIHTAGHTPGSGCFYFAKEQWLLSGDTLFLQGCGRTDLPKGDPYDMALSLQRLLSLPGDTRVYPGHGPETKIEWERNSY